MRLQNNAYDYDNPTIKLEKHFENFLIRSVITLRRTIKFGEIMFGVNMSGPKEFYSQIIKRLPPEHGAIKMLEEDKGWYKELYDFRGDVEHSQHFKVSRFEVLLDADKKPKIKLLALIKKGCLVRDYMSVTLNNVFTYCEDIAAILLELKCNDKFTIVQIPEDLQKDYRGFKYIIDLKSDINQILKWKKDTEIFPALKALQQTR